MLLQGTCKHTESDETHHALETNKLLQRSMHELLLLLKSKVSISGFRNHNDAVFNEFRQVRV